jgi:hypothetical protein
MPRRAHLLVLAAALVPLAAADRSEVEGYRAAAARIAGAALVDGRSREILQHLSDRIGPRLSGSPGAEAAVRWTRERLIRDGLDARLEAVTVPRWVRGEESAEILSPAPQRLAVTALGSSEPTPDGGLEAEVVSVGSFDELKALGKARVRGRIVLYHRVLVPGDAQQDYGALGPLRTRGAVEAARLGAVASLVRSLGTLSARLPHTGNMRYEDGVPRIPAAALAAEDADLVQRLLDSGEAVRVRLRLGCRTLPDVESANVVAELRGRERPDEIVLIAAHLDSWDLGTGAIDDGAGVAAVMDTLRILKSLGLTPRRTVRGVLYMNEENGLRGGRAYLEAHRDALGRHVAAIESDSGGTRPVAFTALTGEGGMDVLEGIVSLLAAVAPLAVEPGGHGGADISPLRAGGVPLLGLRQDTTHYLDWHHTAADTLDKVDPGDLARNTAALAVMAYALAEMPGTLPRPAPEESAAPRPAR